jgi:hypothetical protein
MATPAIAYIHPGADEDRQKRNILGYAHTHHLTLEVICSAPQSCAQAVAGGVASVVIASVDPRNGLRDAVTAAGGTLVLVRERSRVPSLREFLNGAVRQGKTPHDIARLTGDTTGEVARLFERLGLRKPDDRPPK